MLRECSKICAVIVAGPDINSTVLTRRKRQKRKFEYTSGSGWVVQPIKGWMCVTIWGNSMEAFQARNTTRWLVKELHLEVLLWQQELIRDECRTKERRRMGVWWNKRAVTVFVVARFELGCPNCASERYKIATCTKPRYCAKESPNVNDSLKSYCTTNKPTNSWELYFSRLVLLNPVCPIHLNFGIERKKGNVMWEKNSTLTV